MSKVAFDARGSHVAAGWSVWLVRRLHTWIGVAVAPFLLVAAVTGLWYVWTPQIEAWYYRDWLRVAPAAAAHVPLQQQVVAATAYARPEWRLVAVRPALEPQASTRVLFSAPGLGEGERWAIFVNPATADVLGAAVVYGTSGALPLRSVSSLLHRQLLAGETGRAYSELAASWLWVAALGGMYLWWRQRRTATAPSVRVRHVRWGLALLLGLLFLSASGLTWSRWAGDNIGQWRRALGWGTPQLPLQLPEVAPAVRPVATWDSVWAAAQAAGIDAQRVEIRLPPAADKAWSVVEVDRRWPTQVDAVAIDPRTLEVVHVLRFADFPLAAKLTRWAVDLHMGVMFGWPNQLALTVVGLGLLLLMGWGWRMWWRRRSRFWDEPTVWHAWRRAPWRARVVVLAVCVLLGWALPVLGVSLALMALADAVVPWWRARQRRPATTSVSGSV